MAQPALMFAVSEMVLTLKISPSSVRQWLVSGVADFAEAGLSESVLYRT